MSSILQLIRFGKIGAVSGMAAPDERPVNSGRSAPVANLCYGARRCQTQRDTFEGSIPDGAK